MWNHTGNPAADELCRYGLWYRQFRYAGRHHEGQQWYIRHDSGASVPPVLRRRLFKGAAGERGADCRVRPDKRTGRTWRTAVSGYLRRALRKGKCTSGYRRAVWTWLKGYDTGADCRSLWQPDGRTAEKSFYNRNWRWCDTSFACRSSGFSDTDTGRAYAVQILGAGFGRHGGCKQAGGQNHRGICKALCAGIFFVWFQKVGRTYGFPPAFWWYTDPFGISDTGSRLYRLPQWILFKQRIRPDRRLERKRHICIEYAVWRRADWRKTAQRNGSCADRKKCTALSDWCGKAGTQSGTGKPH